MLKEEERKRYSRQMVMPEVGEEGQEKLASSRVLIVGAGGLGSPAAYYLAAAGVGTLGIVDSDRVEMSNLQRQILHRSSTLGEKKTESARRTLEDLNPGIEILTFDTRLEAGNAAELVNGFHVVVDGCDNLKTRFILNDACVLLGRPYVYGSVLRFEGQASVFAPPESGCYRCLFKDLPPADSVPSPEEHGVMGTTPGIIGLVEATETLKLLLKAGEPLYNRLLVYDGLQMSFMEVKFSREPGCPVCGDNPSITSLKEENYSGKA